MLFGSPLLLPGQEEQARITANAIIEIYGMMHYDAVGISAYDLAAGVDFLQEASLNGKVPWLSANLLREADQKPIFKPAVTINKGATRVGIIGITNPAAHDVAKDGFVIVPWQQTLPLLAATMRKSSDLLILLSSLPDQENHRIAEEIEGIHLILRTGEENQPATKVRNTLIVGTAKKGKYLGELMINWQPTKIWGTGKAEQLQSARQKLDQINWRLKRIERKLATEKGTGNTLTQNNDYRNLSTVQKELRREIAALEGSADEKICTYKDRFIALETSLPEKKAIQAVVDRARKEVNLAGKKRTTTSAATAPYLGPQGCTGCHQQQAKGWRNSRHAGSYQTLVA
ncbi:MAG: multiheme c-type cytochrome, partial [Desulfobulbaceae bacterium]|nr:multiheme c-type cytochrome [Desulfobulbaceae bacterium]